MSDTLVKHIHIEESKYNKGSLILIATTHGGKKYVVGGNHHNPTYLEFYEVSVDAKGEKQQEEQK